MNNNHRNANNEKHASLLHAGELETVVGQKGQGELDTGEHKQVQEIDESDTPQRTRFFNRKRDLLIKLESMRIILTSLHFYLENSLLLYKGVKIKLLLSYTDL